MAEKLDLTTPVVETKTTDAYTVVTISMNSELVGIPEPTPPPSTPVIPLPGVVSIIIKDNLGVVTSKQFTGTLAQDMIKFINTGDFTTRSLHKRILEKLSTMGVLVGTVSGTSDAPSAPTGLE